MKVFNRILSNLRQVDQQPKSSIFSRLCFNQVPDASFLRTNPPKQAWIPKSVAEHCLEEDCSLNLGIQNSNSHLKKVSFAEVLMGTYTPPPLTGANSVPVGPSRAPISCAKSATGAVRLLGRSAQSGLLGRYRCSRCFSSSHSRADCHNRLKCSSCFHFGHAAATCHFPPRFPGLSKNPTFSNQINLNCWDIASVALWFRSAPPMVCGTELPWAQRPLPFVSHSATSVPWKAPPPPGYPSDLPSSFPKSPRNLLPPPQSLSLDFGEVVLASQSHPPQRPAVSSPTDPSTLKAPATVTLLGAPAAASSSTMPLRFVDPTPFMPRGFNRVVIEGRRPVSRAILGRQTRLNSDLAIATIVPAPNHQVSFTGIRNILDDFLREHLHVGYRSIQPCPFGQAYVRFNFYHDRDRLIHSSPHVFGNVSISFVAHDRGWNHKKITLNHEVWLMLLGFNVDHWNNRLVDKALGDWGSLVTWEEDPNCLARIMVKAKVVELEDIPWFIYCSENDDFEGDTWVIQCEILQHQMLGAQPADEDIPPNDPNDLNPNLFDFFGLVNLDKDLLAPSPTQMMDLLLMVGICGHNNLQYSSKHLYSSKCLLAILCNLLQGSHSWSLMIF